MLVNYYGIIMGLVMLVATGIGHVLVIKGEYHWGIKIWPLFFIVGGSCLVTSCFVNNLCLSGSLGITGVTFLWGILELFHQKRRVEKGWFPKKNKTDK